LYQITVAGEHSVQFAIQEDVWRRTVPKAVGYYRYQRCGVEVPGVHPACHLDDARRRYYRLTALGRCVLDAECERLQELVQTIRMKQAAVSQ
jgi:hypothetical protein